MVRLHYTRQIEWEHMHNNHQITTIKTVGDRETIWRNYGKDTEQYSVYYVSDNSTLSTNQNEGIVHIAKYNGYLENYAYLQLFGGEWKYFKLAHINWACTLEQTLGRVLVMYTGKRATPLFQEACFEDEEPQNC